MKNLKLCLFIIAFIFIISLTHSTFSTQLEKPDINATTAVVIDSKNGDVLYGIDENKVMFPASTTKILTAILAIENTNLDDTVTVSKTAISDIPSGYSIAYLKEGEVVSISDLLKMLLLISANDAANVLAETVSGSVDNFADLMNEKIVELGLSSTHFTNSYGLHDIDHYSSAYDLAIILNYCISNPTYLEISQITSCTINATNLSDERVYSNGNKLLLPNHDYYYEFATAGKTGFTTPAGNCLVSSASKDNLDLVCVVLNSSSTFLDSSALFEYAFSKFTYVELMQKNSIVTQIQVSNTSSNNKMLELKTNNSIGAVVNVDNLSNYDYTLSIYEDVHAPIEEGAILGTISYVVGDNVYSAELLAARTVDSSNMFVYIFGIAFIIIIAYILLTLVSYFIHTKKRL